jgi:hypothetical protein
VQKQSVFLAEKDVLSAMMRQMPMLYGRDQSQALILR